MKWSEGERRDGVEWSDGERGDEGGGRVWGRVRKGGDTVALTWCLKSMMNDKCCLSFGLGSLSPCFHLWAVVFICGWLLSYIILTSYVGIHFYAWAFVFMCGRLFLCVGIHLCM